MINRFFAALGRIGIYFFSFAIGVGITLFFIQRAVFTPAIPGDQSMVLFEVPKGSNIKIIARKLEEEGIIKHWWAVYYLSRLLSAEDGGSKGLRIISGEYKLSRGSTPKEILRLLLSGDVVKYQVVIPEGFRVKDVVGAVTKVGLVSKEELEGELGNITLLNNLGVKSDSFEGYLFPSTYSFTKPITAARIIGDMVNEGRNQLSLKINNWVERAIDLKLTQQEVFVLASIIEKETARSEERPIISSVFHNRLEIGMPLQSDPTVIYGIAEFNGNLTKEDLQRPGPYNTYLNTGLPPTPICNPGVESIRAALFPQGTEYLYFVAKGDGFHHFSTTYKEHLQAVSRFQLGRGTGK